MSDLKKKLIDEIDDVKTPELFLAYHAKWNSHLISRHMCVSINDLKQRLSRIPFKADEIVSMSRFYSESISEVANFIYICLRENGRALYLWLEGGRKSLLELDYDFSEPIGDCLVKGTDWRYPIPNSRIRVLVGYPENNDRLFKVINAYPELNNAEVDLAWDAIDAYAETIKDRSDKKRR